MVSKVVIGAGVATVLAVGAGAYLLSQNAVIDRGAGTDSSLPAASNVPKNDQMTPVPPNDADRRATVNQEDAQRARQEDRDYQAPTVITQTGPADQPDIPVLPEKKEPEIQERIIKERHDRTVYVTRVPVEQPVDDAAARAGINDQIKKLMTLSTGAATDKNAVSMVSNTYAKPEEKKEPVAAGNGQGKGPPPRKSRMFARTGDVIFARLDRGFNSDDPNAPILVTLDDVIYDPVRGQRPGPLTGMRLVGQIQYSGEQSAINFTKIVTRDGHEFTTNAIAISEREARTGIATDVDKHTLQRWSGLLVGSLIQGAGQVANELVRGNRTVTVSDGVVVSGANNVNYGQAAVAALQPLGNNLASIAQQQFARPHTMTAQAGTGVGIVFLSPVILPEGLN